HRLRSGSGVRAGAACRSSRGIGGEAGAVGAEISGPQPACTGSDERGRGAGRAFGATAGGARFRAGAGSSVRRLLRSRCGCQSGTVSTVSSAGTIGSGRGERATKSELNQCPYRAKEIGCGLAALSFSASGVNYFRTYNGFDKIQIISSPTTFSHASTR